MKNNNIPRDIAEKMDSMLKNFASEACSKSSSKIMVCIKCGGKKESPYGMCKNCGTSDYLIPVTTETRKILNNTNITDLLKTPIYSTNMALKNALLQLDMAIEKESKE